MVYDNPSSGETAKLVPCDTARWMRADHVISATLGEDDNTRLFVREIGDLYVDDPLDAAISAIVSLTH